jgi:O-acetylhomoserine (thiol)-lyase
LETLSLRIERSCENALSIARYLEDRSKPICAVNYPGLPSSPYHSVAKRQLAHGFGGVLTFTLESQKECFAFMDSLRLIRRATNINDNKTLILHPSSSIYCEYSPAEKQAMGVSDSLLRLSVGIEDVEDIVEDLERGLAAI